MAQPAACIESSSRVLSDDIPPQYICPITLAPMRHPLLSKTGYNFERDAILDWLVTSNGTCPMTRKPLSPRDLIPNHNLEDMIRFWRRKRENSRKSDAVDTSTSSSSFSGCFSEDVDDSDEDTVDLSREYFSGDDLKPEALELLFSRCHHHYYLSPPVAVSQSTARRATATHNNRSHPRKSRTSEGRHSRSEGASVPTQSGESSKKGKFLTRLLHYRRAS